MFEGETISDVLAGVLKNEPDLNAVPAQVRPLLAACLEKDPRKRLRDIGDWRRSLGDAPATAAGSPKAKRSVMPWIAATIFALAAAGLGALHLRETPPAAPVFTTSILPPDGADFQFLGNLSTSGPPAISPDGRRIVFRATAGGHAQLWLRSLETSVVTPIPGTDNAIHPFWSPNSRTIGFFTEGLGLRRVEASGGPATSITDAGLGSRGGTWNKDGVIVIGGGSGLYRVSATGGTATRLPMSGRWPSFLPDGRHFLFLGDDALRVGSLEPEKGLEGGKVLVQSVTNAVFADGYVLFLRGNLLMAQPFDLRRLAFTGEAVPALDNVQGVGIVRRGVFDAAPGGLLVALREAGGQGTAAQLAWYDRKGKKLGTVGEKGPFLATFEPSPDGRRVAVSLAEAGGNRDIWICDLQRDIRTRLTFDPAPDSGPVWTPDGKWLYWYRKENIYRRPADQSGAEELFLSSAAIPRSISPDGKWLIVVGRGNGLVSPPMLISLQGDRKSYPLAAGQALPPGRAINFPSFSPDGRWLLYASDETGRGEIYVSRFAGPGAPVTGKRQISTGGGFLPRWRADGREIVFNTVDRELFAAEVKPGDTALESGKPVRLFVPGLSAGLDFGLSPDGSRILMLSIEGGERTTPDITLIQNWPATLRH